MFLGFFFSNSRTFSSRELSEISLGDLTEGRLPTESWALKRLVKDDSYSRFLKLYVDRFNLGGEDADSKRRELMLRSNPRYVLRNWMAQRVTDMANDDDFEGVRACSPTGLLNLQA